MTFAQSQLLYLFLIFPAISLFLVWASRRHRYAVSELGDPTLIESLSLSVNRRGRRMRTLLWFTALALVIVSLARPQWGSEVEIVERRGVQIIVALDISRSMLAQDIKPDRLSRAKLEIIDLMGYQNGGEVGLVLFSGAAFMQFPLTFDYATARMFLENAEPGIISRPGTVLGEAIDVALAGFNPKRTSQKVIVIMTDGEGHEGDPLIAARRAAEDGVIIYTVGFGTSYGEPIPELDAHGKLAGYKKDSQGDVILSKLDEVTLQQIALASGGRYYRAGADASAIYSLAEDLNSLREASIQSEFKTRQVERFQMFLLVAFVALVSAELIPNRVGIRFLRRPT